MKITETLYIDNRDDWRNWLLDNHSTSKEIWLIYYKKHTGKPRIPYGDAVEEALCFGWIDSIVKRVDDEIFVQRFTPRKKKSVWSDLNKGRVRYLIKSGKMTEIGLLLVTAAKQNGEWDKPSRINLLSTEGVNLKIDIPNELNELLERNKKAVEFYNSLTKIQQNSFCSWIADGKKTETRKRRAKKAILALNNKKRRMM